jgi:hypothetical protein
MNSTAAAALVENILLGCINATNVPRILVQTVMKL